MMKENQVVLILGGDIFDDHDPSEDLIAFFLDLMNLLKVNNIETKIIDGNHESVPDPERISCLSFIKKAAVGYPNIELIQRIAVKTYKVGGKKVLLTLLPHISRASIADVLEKYGNTQTYIDKTCQAILKKYTPDEFHAHVAASHLNIKGAHPGSEENLLRRSEAYLPTCFTNSQPGTLEPLIMNGHIHTNQKFGNNTFVIGSPLFCSFGEKYEKYFGETTVDEEGTSFELFPTPFTPFEQLDLLINSDENRDISELPEFKEFKAMVLSNSATSEKPVVKINVTIAAEKNNYNWKEVQKEIAAELSATVLPIEPKVIQHRVVRNVNQKPSLSPDQAVKVFLKNNLGKQPDRMKSIYRRAKPYITGEVL